MKDNVAQHTFYVAWYAIMTAELIKWDGPKYNLVISALGHDLDETVTADITGPVKSQVMRDDAHDYIDQRMLERMGDLFNFYLEASVDGPQALEIDKIVGFADMLDSLLFLEVNKRMGNKCAIDPAEVLLKKAEARWRSLPAPKDELDKLWQTVVYPAIIRHRVQGGCGI